MEIEEAMRRFFQDSGIERIAEKYVEFMKKYGDKIELKHEYSPGDVCAIEQDNDVAKSISTVITKVRYVPDGTGSYRVVCDGIKRDGTTISGCDVKNMKYLGFQTDYEAAMCVLFGNFAEEE